MLRLEERGELPRRRLVEDERARQRRRALAERLLQLVAQLHRAERVEPRLHQRRVRIDRAARRARRQRQHRLERHRRRGTRPRSRGCRCLHSHGRSPPVPMRRQQCRHHAAPLAPSSLGQSIGKTAASLQCGDSAQLNASCAMARVMAPVPLRSARASAP